MSSKVGILLSSDFGWGIQMEKSLKTFKTLILSHPKTKYKARTELEHNSNKNTEDNSY